MSPSVTTLYMFRMFRMFPLLRACFFASLAFTIVLAGGGVARAGEPALLVRESPGGFVELTRNGQGYEGSFAVRNTSSSIATLTASVLGSERDPRSPPGVTVEAQSASSSASSTSSARVAPGAEARFRVRWVPGVGGAHEAFAHVVVQAPGAGSVAVGVRARAQEGAPFVPHVLSLLVVIPFVGAIAIALASRRFGSERLAGAIGVGAAAVNVILAAMAYAHFDPSLGRRAGNDGLQLIERATLSRVGVEYFVGVDGASIGVIVLVAVVTLTGLVALGQAELRRTRLYVAALLLAGAAQGVSVAVDLALLLFFWLLALCAAAWLSGAHTRLALRRVVPFFALSILALALAVVVLAHAGGPALLGDGALAPRAFSLPALVRADLAHSALWGIPVARLAWVLSLLGLAPFLPLFPLQGWLLHALSRGPNGVGVLLVGLMQPLAILALARCALVASDGVVWSADVLAYVGAGSALATALAATAERDVRRAAALLMGVVGGLALLGLAARTPAAVAGFLASATAAGLGGAALLALLGAVVSRGGVASREAFGGLAREMPWLGAALALVLVTPFGAAGLLGAWAAFASVSGAFARAPGAACVGALAAAVGAYASYALARSLLFGTFPAVWRQSPRLEPFGGRFPDLTKTERACFLPLVAAAALLAVWPRPVFAPLERAALELSAFFDPPGPMQITESDDDKTLHAQRACR